MKHLIPDTFLVATNNSRILELEVGWVTFRYFASDNRKSRVCPVQSCPGLCTLPTQELIRRFLQHVLPGTWSR